MDKAPLSAVAAAALLAAAGWSLAEEPRPSLSGVWVLNEKDSDDVRQKMRESMPGPGRGGPGGGRGGPGGGRGGPGGGIGGPMGGGGRRGGPGGTGGSDRGGPPMDGERGGGPMGRAKRELTIDHREPEITVVDAEGTTLRMKTDGRETPHDGETGKLKTRARWKEKGLEVTTTRERGKTQETYALVPGQPPRLVVIVKVERPWGGSFTLRRVYDPAPVTPGPPPPTEPGPQPGPTTENKQEGGA